ncbi:hypothetical protein ACIA6D_30715 [Streptomyces cacaoi]
MPYLVTRDNLIQRVHRQRTGYWHRQGEGIAPAALVGVEPSTGTSGLIVAGLRWLQFCNSHPAETSHSAARLPSWTTRATSPESAAEESAL